MNEAIKEVELKKRQLEEQVDSLNEEVSRMKANEEMHKVASDKREEEIKMKDALEQQISQHREQHQKQVNFQRTKLWNLYYTNNEPTH